MNKNKTKTKTKKQETESFPAKLLAIATLQIISNSTPFTAIRPIPLATLTHVATSYLELLAQAARAHADHSGRTLINASDISGLLEHLQGPGALAALHNWSQHNLNLNNSQQKQISHPIDKLAHLAQNLKEFRHTPPAEPITTLSFLPLTDAEITALDHAGESDLEENHPSPSSSSSSSEGNSLVETLLRNPPTSPPPLPPKEPSSIIQEQDTIKTRWRSIHDIPPYVPSHFPPFPGLEHIPETHIDSHSTIIPQEPLQSSTPHSPPPPPPPPPPPISTNEQQNSTTHQSNPYLFAVPYSNSQLSECHGPSFVAPTTEPRCSLPGVDQEQDDDNDDEASSRKKAKLSSPMEGFLKTYAYMVEEKVTSSKSGTEEPKFLKRNSVRQRLISEDRVEPMASSLLGMIPGNSVRTNRWSAGWIPHPPAMKGRVQPAPELKPHGHTPLPVPVTMAVPIQFPACPPFHQPHPRVPDLIPRLFERVRQDARGDQFTLLTRMSRLAPPSELGDAGEALPYRIKDLLPPPPPTHQDPSTPASAIAQQPKYLEWGFHWPPLEGRDPLPPARPPSHFSPPEFPGMPKTTAEKLRLVQREKDLAAAAAAANSNPTPSGSAPMAESII
ncbi:hypothetical protein PCASD_10508 [Puccinia coronata f. sp. avenae]|uniref:Bromodomain associated domain-containing protein n=1 Tax=Puccinia coronata f. sp. avenae TaxID=200324 RepID=A0A2N5TCH3_9BASI|nr:hypothetical protein PCASD_10508 [Puccinia coronata f. sp. avenae]